MPKRTGELQDRMNVLFADAPYFVIPNLDHRQDIADNSVGLTAKLPSECAVLHVALLKRSIREQPVLSHDFAT